MSEPATKADINAINAVLEALRVLMVEKFTSIEGKFDSMEGELAGVANMSYGLWKEAEERNHKTIEGVPDECNLRMMNCWEAVASAMGTVRWNEDPEKLPVSSPFGKSFDDNASFEENKKLLLWAVAQQDGVNFMSLTLPRSDLIEKSLEKGWIVFAVLLSHPGMLMCEDGRQIKCASDFHFGLLCYRNKDGSTSVRPPKGQTEGEDSLTSEGQTKEGDDPLILHKPGSLGNLKIAKGTVTINSHVIHNSCESKPEQDRKQIATPYEVVGWFRCPHWGFKTKEVSVAKLPANYVVETDKKNKMNINEEPAVPKVMPKYTPVTELIFTQESRPPPEK